MVVHYSDETIRLKLLARLPLATLWFLRTRDATVATGTVPSRVQKIGALYDQYRYKIRSRMHMCIESWIFSENRVEGIKTQKAVASGRHSVVYLGPNNASFASLVRLWARPTTTCGIPGQQTHLEDYLTNGMIFRWKDQDPYFMKALWLKHFYKSIKNDDNTMDPKSLIASYFIYKFYKTCSDT